MQIEEIIDILKADFDCDESGLDWQEHKYLFENDGENAYDIKVNGITVPFVFSVFATDDQVLIFSKGDLVLAEVPREIIETIEVIKK
ncbi:MAG: hypothetical protein Q4P18_06515 [Methanobrevibacter sp.]|uniref:hypothetical protein n=1 Tax=Methanobrevibacter sp. TaxID=66852 RepID=UPI0026E0EC16|nr:hypothetical protein [Methanobrevibacter sp.]MDO5849168.1 hypothetical protein [Methanobrevibacter sp.]